MTGNIQSLDAARRARLAGADAEGMARRAATANIYVTRAEETLALLSEAGDEPTRAALRNITETWLQLATGQLATLPTSA